MWGRFKEVAPPGPSGRVVEVTQLHRVVPPVSVEDLSDQLPPRHRDVVDRSGVLTKRAGEELLNGAPAMAVYLRYRQIAHDETSVEYEIHTGPDDPEPLRIQVSKVADAPVPTDDGSKVAANKAIRRIVQRSVIEGSWPAGGVIQS